MTENKPSPSLTKQCAYCHGHKPLSEFRRRTGKRSKGQSRRGACRECRKQQAAAGSAALSRSPDTAAAVPVQDLEAAPAKRKKKRQTAQIPQAPAVSAQPGPKAHLHSLPERSKDIKAGQTAPGAKGRSRHRGTEQHRKPYPQGARPDPQDASALTPSFKGMILMRGHSDKGRRWHQEIDLELAVTLVKEHAAVVVNRRTIRRLYSNKDFRNMILTRDNYTCYFCGLYGDTIDHLLPRAKGGHTTPDNCVCACNLCNQTKADRDVEEFMGRSLQ
ncbi:restriction endonuclease [Paenibacillus sp. PK3_47]|uniref:HNH endonuclease n=1 Tax=Paenibacillus sp. PK3_47 TaxID=2072642 RepID=UPI00201E1080|nr:HNH endonuclease [Paenibacillus sp. PK3_47]UQZ34534.1 restriction endonuclease [Paenibacillus sp. PK3_47]